MQLDEFYNDDEFICAEDELVYQSMLNRTSLNKDASRHLREGFGRRIFMMHAVESFYANIQIEQPTTRPILIWSRN